MPKKLKVHTNLDNVTRPRELGHWNSPANCNTETSEWDSVLYQVFLHFSFHFDKGKTFGSVLRLKMDRSIVFMRLQCFMLLYVNKVPLNYVPDRLILEDGNYRLSRKDSNKVTTMRNIPEERRPHVHRSGSLKSRTVFYLKIISIHICQYRLQYWFSLNCSLLTASCKWSILAARINDLRNLMSFHCFTRACLSVVKCFRNHVIITLGLQR
jgi:hypothetical protein